MEVKLFGAFVAASLALSSLWAVPINPGDSPRSRQNPPQSAWSHEAQHAQLALRPRAQNEAIQFGVIGDAEPGRFPWQRVLPPGDRTFEELLIDLQVRDPDFVVQLGDFVSIGTEKKYAQFVGVLNRLAARPFFPVLGNHDRANPHGISDKTLYRRVFGAGDYYFDRGGCRLVLLDDADSRILPAQLEWLDAVLDTSLRKIVFMHIPPYYLKDRLVSSEGAALQAQETEPAPAGGDRKYFQTYVEEGADRFAEIVEARGVDRVYMGHIHALAFAEVRGVSYVLSGGGGSPLYRFPGIPGKKISHYLLVTAGPDSVSEEVFTLQEGRLEASLP